MTGFHLMWSELFQIQVDELSSEKHLNFAS